MSQMLSLRSVDDLFAFMALAGDDDFLWQCVDLSALRVVIPVSVQGKRRDGRIDADGAAFIRDLQKATDWAFKAYGTCSTGGKKNRIRVKISEGSDKSEIDYTEVTKEAIKKMTGRQITVCILAGLVLAAGYFSFTSFQGTQLEKMKAQLAADHAERMAAVQNKSNEQIIDGMNTLARTLMESESRMGRDLQTPIRKYIRSLGRNETISVNGGPHMKKHEALEKLEPLADTDTMYSTPCDGVYSLHSVELLEGIQGIDIAQDKIKVLALLERLDKETKDSILGTVDASMEQRTRMSMNLQVDVYFTQKKIHHAVVIGVGSPRENMHHFRLQDIPASIPASALRRQGE